MNTANKRSPKPEPLTSVSITSRKNTESFDSAIDMLNINAEFGNLLVGILFFGEFPVFGLFVRNNAVFVNIVNTLIPAVCYYCDVSNYTNFGIFEQLKIMGFAFPYEYREDFSRRFLNYNLYSQSGKQ